MAVKLRLSLAQLPASHLHSQQPVPSLAGQGRSEADGAGHPLPPPAERTAPCALLLTAHSDFSLGQPPRQPPRLCTEQEQELGNYLP